MPSPKAAFVLVLDLVLEQPFLTAEAEDDDEDDLRHARG
jgi:hypothetical protein